MFPGGVLSLSVMPIARYLGYSNVGGTPEIKAYDFKHEIDVNKLPNITKDADGYLTIEIDGTNHGDLEVFPFDPAPIGENR